MIHSGELLPADTRALLERVAGLDGPDEQARERVRAAIAVAQSTAPAFRLLHLPVAKWVVSLTVVAAVGVVAVSSRGIDRHPNIPAKAWPTTNMTLPIFTPKVESVEPRKKSVPELQRAVAPAAHPASSASQQVGELRPSRVSVASGGSRLAEETKMLEDARIELRDGHAARALTLVATYEAKFPHGLLREEGLATEALALCALSRLSDGRAVAQRFARSFPSSPLLPRVQGSCRIQLE